jgi:2-phosphoglycerate kinase
MIYLIGGAPRTGKSIVSNLLMSEVSAPCLSTDVLRTVVHDLLPKEDRAAAFPFGGFTSADELSSMQIKQMVDWQVIEGDSLRKCIDSLVRHQVGVKDNQILEGVHLMPEHVSMLAADSKHAEPVRAVFVFAKDVETQLDMMKKNTSHYDWLCDASDETYLSVANFVVAYGDWVRSECERCDLPFVVRGGDFEKENEEILRVLKEGK